jgi:hypothetical protein
MKQITLILLLAVGMMFSGCAKYERPTTEELTSRKDAYVACKTATKVEMQITDGKDLIIAKLIDKIPGNDPCAELITSGDKAQIEIAKSNNELGGKGMDALKIVGSIFAIEWGNVGIAKKVGEAAGIHAGGSVGSPITTTTTTTETTSIGDPALGL